MKEDRMRALFGGGMGSGSTDRRDPAEGPDERLASAKAIIRAVRSGDAEALDMALEDHYRACEDSKDSSEPDSDDSDYGTD